LYNCIKLYKKSKQTALIYDNYKNLPSEYLKLILFISINTEILHFIYV